MREESLATWDGGNITWGGRVRALGTVWVSYRFRVLADLVLGVCRSWKFVFRRGLGVRDEFWRERLFRVLLDTYQMGLPEFVDDTVTDYTRPTPSIDVLKSVSKEQEERWKNNNPSFFEQGGSSGNVVSKPMIKFVKESGCPNATKVNNSENTRKPTMKYAEMHMTGNISYLSEYEPFNGGYVSFGHGKGKITGKGSIKT
nr:hypothetical protein [Tanacetum cinerariifolium]